jgi:hypothetical protein
VTGAVASYSAEVSGLEITLNALGLSSNLLFPMAMVPLIQSLKALPLQVAA